MSRRTLRMSRGMRTLIGSVLVAVVVLGGWQLALTFSGASSYITKTPLDVLAYLFDDSLPSDLTAAQRRAELGGLVLVTVGHAAIGLVVGVGCGVVGALALASSKTLRGMFMPIAIFLQTVPLIALAPVIYAVFGGGVLTAAVISGVVTFFPLLINLLSGFDSVTPTVRDVITVFGGRRLAEVRFAAIPTSLPYLFAGLRIALPATVSGAMLYEFLFTFEGLGAMMSTSRQYSNYSLMWTIVVVSVLLSVVAYALVALAEKVALGGRYPRQEGTR